ncbi:DUF2971 domain-containing protein [Vibrio parahaemolyticus]|uniref:DUF2971 domain-containing protein n=1 Tax=Vibrio vulnificus TaxID=672 RepID=UPI0019D44584|nr:DUF2971 domain-containing protein [Vibrio parahaemolyticus]EKO5176804.1 DUF2971 domain-containing protein [Vibrio vulnificus]EJC6985780.1 DUF2971 domain-containing protein [Vibrio parahaemolyticus]EJG1904215.1 DUF2971 domain-containing protein [Vibrio parahaemolyticus]EJO2026737.1 DUF2971 domain-containing protein [Vibrio parahaemolyticus]
MSDVIYHYTDIGACQSLIENNQFWLSAHSFMNDEQEYYQGLDILESKLESYIGAAGQYSQEITQQLISHVKEVMIYSTSFSKESDLLSQWRSYCPKEGGVSIGFDKAILEATLCGRKGHANFRYLQDCCYDTKHTDYVADVIAKATLQNLDKMGGTLHETILHENTFLEILTFLARTKNPSFSEEAEVRLFSYGHRKLDGIRTQQINKSPSLQLVNTESVSFRPKQSFLIPFLKIDFPIEAIKEIKIGPSNFQGECMEGLTMYLKSKGLDVKLTYSDIPYRVI